MTIDPFKSESGDVQSPFRTAHAVTLDADFAFTSRAVYAGAAGDLSVVLADGGAATFRGLAAGTALPVAATRVLSANTTIAASNILALL
ncbi:spike base protein, RCAP_Rcc01079 family [Hoeflea sp.]|uniref:spike base protein, RCAP_Rcc01079 family n=1 Tax=Hoeflea sp. TaxID=1940281 RepID=UPI003B024664